jgi:outer membrane autotransporter protein
MASIAVEGVQQSVLGLLAQASFSNSGELLVGAGADASADTAATAEAMAIGYSVSGTGFAVDFANTGDFTVIAQAVADGASGIASAHAVGFSATASSDGFLNGTIENSGNLVVNAKADAAGNASAYAQATGLGIGAGSSDLTISNSGLLSVSAATDGGTSEATAIRILDTGAASDPSAVITITNDGGLIIARRSEDGGESWLRGTAIDTSAAPNASVINLVGDGGIYGDISVAAGDTINVAGAETWFDGIINPACAGGGCGQGMLNVGDGGALFLRHNSAGNDGPSAAYVEQLNIAADGTLIFELPSGAGPESAYPQITADVANLDGTLLVRSASGLYADSYLFQDVIDADTRDGQFDSCGIDGSPALLELSCVYDGEGNVDLGIERVAFNAVAGLTRNQAAVGSGIEEVYDVGLTGPFAEMVEELFGFEMVEYRDALNQLTGAVYAAYLQSFNALGVQQNQLLDRATGCELPDKLASSLSCRTGTVRLWGQVDYTNRRHDGDVEAPAYDAGQWTAIVGGDVPVGADAVVGASLAKVSNRLSFRRGGDSDADGYQAGVYGVFDPGAYYAKVFATLGWYDGDSRRRIDWTPMGGTLAGQLRGDPDVRLATLGAHFGYRVALGETSVLTPFLNVDYTSAKLDGFTESGLAGAALDVKSSTSTRTVATVGAKWAGDVGGVVPQAELGYRHLFGDRRASFDVAFAGQEGSGFEIVSAADKRGSLFGGLSLGGRVGKVDVRVGYQGLFDGNSTSHSGSFRIILPLGKE